jgi:hypothetical protein
MLIDLVVPDRPYLSYGCKFSDLDTKLDLYASAVK